MYDLYIANKNYSSWSLRPWVLMRELGIEFTEHLLVFGDESQWQAFRRMAPGGKVPVLIDGAQQVWESLAIVEYLAERHAGVWSADAAARAWARSASAEMHAGFGDLRTCCSMNCGVRMRLHEHPEGLVRDVARIGALWNEGLRRFGGPFLCGSAFTAADAFFAPVAFRVQTYGLTLDAAAGAYAARILSLTSMRTWYAQAIAETFRDAPHEDDMRPLGVVTDDFRRT